MKILLMIGSEERVIDNVVSFTTLSNTESTVIQIELSSEIASDSILNTLLPENETDVSKQESATSTAKDVVIDSPEVMKIKPSSTGFFPVADVKIAGASFPVVDDRQVMLKTMRKDFNVQVIYTPAQLDNLTILTAEKKITSSVFTSLNDVAVRSALHDFVVKEQSTVNIDGKNNFLFEILSPMLVVQTITDVKLGLGEFYFSEVIAVYGEKKVSS